MCTVSGGATGYRQGWLKANGVVQRFETAEDAEQEAERLTAAMRGRGTPGARFTYEVAPYYSGLGVAR